MPPGAPHWQRQLFDAYPSLDGVSAEQREALTSQGVCVEADTGDILFEPRDFAIRYPFILAGVARVLKVGTSSPDTLLYRLRPGEHCLLSASGLLARWRFGARVVAETDARVVLIPGALFRDMVWRSPDFAHSVHVAIARRLEVVMDLVEQATHLRLDRRVASLILACGTPVSASHQDMADDLGASRENVSRVLGEFRDHGWVKLGRRRIDIVDRAALRTFIDRDW